MPHIDARSGEVVIRIVYDGAPEAGKTTNVQQLSNLISLQRRGASKSPGTTGERTEFFDWLDFSGGYLDGRRVRCQLVSVPGQSRLLHRRRYLLETADAVVFVADSRVEMFDGAAGNFLATLRIVERVCRGVPVGVIVQANKQDLPGALAPEMVMAALGATKPVLAIGSAASRGDGVMQTFILAVRLATDRVRTLLLDETLSDLPMASETPDGLHGAMVEIEGNAPPPIPPLYSPPPPVLDDDALQSEASGERERLAAETLRIAAERAEAERLEAERAE
ncbi:MAG: gliding motility protein MglA, partial [Deltaproteobacteria bacterium]|nr:gliding motility protein MglA [Deltaproteobacteria bacterium]